MNIKILVLSIVLTLCAFCLWACASEGLRPDESAETETAALSAVQEPVSEAATESPPPAENEKIEADGLCYRIEDGRAVVW